MPNLNITTYSYSDGSYDLDETGSKIPVETITASFDWTGASAVSGPPVRKVSSFDIIDNGDSFTTRVNKSRRVGCFLSSATAVGALVGTFFGSGVGSVSAVETLIGDQISRGVSSLDVPAGSGSPTGKKSSPASFSYGKPNDQPDAFYNSGALDRASGVRPDDVMPEVLDLMGGQPNLITMYPDAATAIITDQWHNFSPDDWDGVSALPSMDPSEYVAYLDFIVAQRGVSPSSTHNVMMDWESGTTETARKGVVYWNDPATTKYRDALTELRAQQALVYDALKEAYPSFGFGMYGGIVGYGQFEGRWDNTNKVWTSTGSKINNASGTRWYGTLKNDADKLAELNQGAADSIAACPLPWDFVTIVGYNYFTQDAFAKFADSPPSDATSDNPTFRKEYYQWMISTLKANCSAPVYAIVSPTAENRNNYSTADNYNSADFGYFSDDNNIIEQTIAMVDGVDGYMIWDSLRAQAYTAWCSSYPDWASVPSDYKTQYSTEWLMFDDLERKYNFLTEFAEKWNVPLPASAEDWFNLELSIRDTDWTENLLVGRTSSDLLNNIVPLFESWRRTGVVPETVSQDLGTIAVFSPGSFGQFTPNPDFWDVFTSDPPVTPLPLSILGVDSGGPAFIVSATWDPDERIKTGDLYRFVVSGEYFTAPISRSGATLSFLKMELINALLQPGATLDRFYKLEPYDEVQTKKQIRVQRKRARIKTKNNRSYERISSIRLKIQAVNEWIVSQSPKRQAKQATVLQRLRDRISRIYSKVTYRLGRW